MSNSVLSSINVSITNFHAYDFGRSMYDMAEYLLITTSTMEENDYFLNHFSKLI